MITEIRLIYKDDGTGKIEVYGKPAGSSASTIISTIVVLKEFSFAVRNKILNKLSKMTEGNPWLSSVLQDEISIPDKFLEGATVFSSKESEEMDW